MVTMVSGNQYIGSLETGECLAIRKMEKESNGSIGL